MSIRIDPTPVEQSLIRQAAARQGIPMRTFVAAAALALARHVLASPVAFPSSEDAEPASASAETPEPKESPEESQKEVAG